jgi:hypothetical protein
MGNSLPLREGVKENDNFYQLFAENWKGEIPVSHLNNRISFTPSPPAV